MGKPYSDDLHDRVVAAMAAGRSCRNVGSAFQVAPSTAGNWYRGYQQTTSYAARPMGGDRRSKLAGEAGWIADRLTEASELTLGEVRGELARRGVVVSYASVRRLGLRHEKRTIFATEQDRPDVALARDIWRAAQTGLDLASLVFVDETGTTTSMTRLRGWGRKGQSLLGQAPRGLWMTSTPSTACKAGAQDRLRCRASAYGLLAPMLIDAPVAGAIVQQWLTQHLIPEMRPGRIVVCDNLPAHKVADIRQCLEDAGIGLLYLPPYSPDLNALLSEVEGPIEQVFANVKALLRRAAPRSFDAICNALKTILDTFKPNECSNYIRHSGYVQT